MEKTALSPSALTATGAEGSPSSITETRAVAGEPSFAKTEPAAPPLPSVPQESSRAQLQGESEGRKTPVPPLLPDLVPHTGIPPVSIPGTPHASPVPVIPGTPHFPSMPSVPGTPATSGAGNVAGAPPVDGAGNVARTPPGGGTGNAAGPGAATEPGRRGIRQIRHGARGHAASSAGSAATRAVVTKIIVIIVIGVVITATAAGAVKVIASHGSGQQGTAAASTPVVITKPVPPTQTSCPAAGTARAAVLAPLALGRHDTLVYIENTQSTAVLKRYDVQSGQTTTILSLPNTLVADAQVTPDGQWVLFDTETETGQPPLTNFAKMQLVRLDGQGLQTLYCYATTASYSIVDPETVAAISPDQQYIAFLDRNVVSLLTLRTGRLQQYVPALSGGQVAGQQTFYYYPPLGWLDNTHLYLTSVYQGTDGSVPLNIYMLDIARGPLASANGLTLVSRTTVVFCWDYDVNQARTRLYLSQCPGTQGGIVTGTSSITSQPVTGGPAAPIYSTTANVITTVRALGNNALLFYLAEVHAISGQPTGDTSRDGWWRINADGSGLTRLTVAPSSSGFQPDAQPNTFSRLPWATVSRDARFMLTFAPGVTDMQLIGGGNLSVVPLNGGAASVIASVSPNDSLASYQISGLVPAGWTTT